MTKNTLKQLIRKCIKESLNENDYDEIKVDDKKRNEPDITTEIFGFGGNEYDKLPDEREVRAPKTDAQKALEKLYKTLKESASHKSSPGVFTAGQLGQLYIEGYRKVTLAAGNDASGDFHFQMVTVENEDKKQKFVFFNSGEKHQDTTFNVQGPEGYGMGRLDYKEAMAFMKRWITNDRRRSLREKDSNP